MHGFAFTQTLLLDLAAHVEHGGSFKAWQRRMRVAIKAPGEGEPWAENDPALPRLERAGATGMVLRWRKLRDQVMQAVGVPSRKALAAFLAKAPEPFGQPWTFDHSTLQRLLALGDEFTRDATTVEGPLTRAVWQAFVRGWVNAGTDLDIGTAIDDTLTRTRVQLQHRGFELVRDGVARELRDKIIAELSTGVYDGLDPISVAERLRERFGRSEYNWERLVRSEMAIAQVDGKLQHFAEAGITEVDYITAEDAKVSVICRGLAAGGPYPLASAPVPVRDSHPNCRCSLRAHASD